MINNVQLKYLWSYAQEQWDHERTSVHALKFCYWAEHTTEQRLGQFIICSQVSITYSMCAVFPYWPSKISITSASWYATSVVVGLATPSSLARHLSISAQSWRIIASLKDICSEQHIAEKISKLFGNIFFPARHYKITLLKNRGKYYTMWLIFLRIHSKS